MAAQRALLHRLGRAHSHEGVTSSISISSAPLGYYQPNNEDTGKLFQFLPNSDYTSDRENVDGQIEQRKRLDTCSSSLEGTLYHQLFLVTFIINSLNCNFYVYFEEWSHCCFRDFFRWWWRTSICCIIRLYVRLTYLPTVYSIHCIFENRRKRISKIKSSIIIHNPNRISLSIASMLAIWI